MPKIIISGKNPLKGEIQAVGAKNAITKLLVASIISDKKSIFHNVPDIGDVEITTKLCQEIGTKLLWDKKTKTIEAITKEFTTTNISQEFSGANRIPILMMGALLGRTKENIIVPTLGGDRLGKRPLDFHIKALMQMGAEVEFCQEKDKAYYIAQAPNGLVGCTIELPFPSVGATENSILAASRAKGCTIIKNAAMEPEIIDLILFLQKIGVDITTYADRTIQIRETKQFYETKHNVIFDRNEVASYGLAAISTKGDVLIKGAEHQHMISFLNKLREVGGGFEVTDEGIRFFYAKSLKGGVHIETDVHPGFMTDWQPLFGVLLTQCEGSSVIHETVYENRFVYIQTLKQMGADIDLFTHCLGEKKCRFALLHHQHSVVIKGKTELQGINIAIPDLRAGFAYIMAALLSKEVSNISGIDFLDRGYENLIPNLQSLGAQISIHDETKQKLQDIISH